MLFGVPERFPSSVSSAKEHRNFHNLVESGTSSGFRWKRQVNDHLKITSVPGLCDLVLTGIGTGGFRPGGFRPGGFRRIDSSNSKWQAENVLLAILVVLLTRCTMCSVDCMTVGFSYLRASATGPGSAGLKSHIT